jgi:hypothetical protein
MTQPTIQSGGPINGADAITIELIQPYSMSAVVRIVWPTAATITTPARYLEVAAAAMKVLAESSTTLARIEPAKLQATGAAIVKVLSTAQIEYAARRVRRR